MITQATEIPGVLVEANNAFSYGEASFYSAGTKRRQRVLCSCHSLKTECRPDVYFPPASENKTTERSAIVSNALALRTRRLYPNGQLWNHTPVLTATRHEATGLWSAVCKAGYPLCFGVKWFFLSKLHCTRFRTLIVATIYLQLIQNRYMFRSFTVLHCSHQHCVKPVASDMEVVGYL